MDRLKDIERHYNACLEVEEEDFDWLVEQVKKVEGMRKEIENCYRDIEELTQEKSDLEKLIFEFKK